jgi:hypothetical protein
MAGWARNLLPYLLRSITKRFDVFDTNPIFPPSYGKVGFMTSRLAAVMIMVGADMAPLILTSSSGACAALLLPITIVCPDKRIEGQFHEFPP